jgi:hypothetical protein
LPANPERTFHANEELHRSFASYARIHSEAQIAQLVSSIQEFGFTNPVLIDESNTIIAGEGRARAAKKLKLEVVPCVVLDGLTEAQKAAYVIADNKLALNAGWDEHLLSAELLRLDNLDFKTHLTGFSEVELLTLLDGLLTEVGDATPAANEPTLETVEPSPTSGDGSPEPAPPPSKRQPAAQPDWTGMPTFTQPDNGPFRTIHVHFNDQAAVDAFAALLQRKLSDKTKFLWYPEEVKTPRSETVYA